MAPIWSLPMFIGRLADLPAQRACLPEAVVRALEALRALDLESLLPGRHDIDGDRMFVLVQDATPRAIDDSLIEAHATYADVQIPLGARECFGFALPQPGLVACDDQLAERDLVFYPNPENEAFIDVRPANTSFSCPENCTARAWPSRASRLPRSVRP